MQEELQGWPQTRYDGDMSRGSTPDRAGTGGAATRGRGSRPRLWLPCVVFVIFAGLLVAGLLLGEFRDVLANAANICLSCIGID